MKQHYTDENTGISYTLHGDYYLPDLRLPPQPEPRPIGKYGYMHKRFLMEHHRAYFDQLVRTGKLNTVLADINELANEQIEQISKQMAKAQGITEHMKICDMMKWVGMMNSIYSAAEEIVLNDLIYT